IIKKKKKSFEASIALKQRKKPANRKTRRSREKQTSLSVAGAVLLYARTTLLRHWRCRYRPITGCAAFGEFYSSEGSKARKRPARNCSGTPKSTVAGGGINYPKRIGG